MDKRIVLSLFDRTLAEKEPELGIPELTDGFQFYGGGCAGGMFPVSFFFGSLRSGHMEDSYCFQSPNRCEDAICVYGKKAVKGDSYAKERSEI
ncbi:hypothetical protein [Enterocloster alcoholdehydrogenati]|uniref:hypothetical protein n=1 Tax=Enterocloster alcoholdehydrogenati TaxID=2547410 RepID=UPI0015943F55|nr:hypothetical protein [Enterocloster alcoholdehydrogenati]